MYHAVAVALVMGKGEEQAFTDQVDMTVTLVDGRTLHLFIEPAVGSQDHPMSDAQLEEKFFGLTDGILDAGRSKHLAETCWKGWELQDAGDIGRAGPVA